jgi:hypothetical protein
MLRHMLGDQHLHGPMEEVLRLLDHSGTHELGKLLSRFIAQDGAVSSDIDYAAIVKMLGQLVSQEDRQWGSVLDRVGGFLEKNPNGVNGEYDGLSLLKELGKVAVGDDPKSRAMIDAADALLRIFADDK